MLPDTRPILERDEALERLDLMLAVLQLAHQDAIERAADQLRSDPVNTAIPRMRAPRPGSALASCAIVSRTRPAASRGRSRRTPPNSSLAARFSSAVPPTLARTGRRV